MKRNKYGAIKTTIDGIVFDSKLEARRYQQLSLLQRAGKISCLIPHRRYQLHALGGDIVGYYEVDFDYYDNEKNAKVYEDCKGVISRLSAWKIKHFQLEYRLKVDIIRK